MMECYLRECAGGDFNYRKMILKFAQYFLLLDPMTFVYRLDGQFIDGNAPFYDLSRIRLRGYSGLEFLDKKALTAQAEIGWNFYRRWTVLGFGGGGRVAKSISDLGSAPTNYAAGGGIRYLIDEKRKLNLGVDIAYAEGTEASVYIQVGDWLAN
jgi:hemolysin activation/secretion protein